jgi:hypothetical protein
LQETIERRELENRFGTGRLPLIKNKKHFKEGQPKKTFLEDDEELE